MVSLLRGRTAAAEANDTTTTTTTTTIGGPLVLSNGSSRVHLPISSTDVLCSVKADLVRPSSLRPNTGVCELCVDLSLSCGGIGDGIGGGGGPSRRRGGVGRRAARQEDESELSSLLTRLVLPHTVDGRGLVVWPGRYVWRLSIDVVVIRADECVLDACSVAIRAALINVRLPRVVPLVDGDAAASSGVVGGSGDDDDGGMTEMTIGYGELFPGEGGEGGGKGDLLVDGDYGRARPPPGAGKCPLIITVSVLRAPLPRLPPSSSSSTTNAASAATTTRQYHSMPIIDARAEEEVCASSRVCVSVDLDGVVCGAHTLGGGGAALSEEEEEEECGCVGGGGGGRGSLPLAMLGDVVTSVAMASRRLYVLLRNDDRGEGANERLVVLERRGRRG
ncbi:hypothetical protein ACHAW5_001058 [Stephanodiscus triporus]|uniref:Ribosomal RNA-processing protein 42 n=1 Tax=Stephanodiscus triporus TaxID=2934178 RepID=A0ABD3PPY1_9STRA